MPDTPLGRIVAIRSEKDQKVISKFTADQKKIRNDWLKRKNQKAKETGNSTIDWTAFQAWARAAFS